MNKKEYKKYQKDRKEIYNITRRLYYLLRNHKDSIYFQKIHGGIYGYYERGTEEIHIDYRREIIPTLIHEALHKWHPEWSETKVLREESRIVNALSSRQIKNILKAIGECST